MTNEEDFVESMNRIGVQILKSNYNNITTYNVMSDYSDIVCEFEFDETGKFLGVFAYQ